MTNGDPAHPLTKALADATKPPEPPRWVRFAQMGLAALSFGGAFAVALILLLHGPPAPKTPEEPNGTSGSGQTTSAPSTGGGSITYVAAEEGGSSGGTEEGGGESGEEGGGESEEEGGGESEGAIPDSFANLNEQAPWAFAIVALLIGAFIATGKSLNFSGTKQE